MARRAQDIARRLIEDWPQKEKNIREALRLLVESLHEALGQNVIAMVLFGSRPVDREFEKLGYDIESKDPRTEKLRFIEVKDRASGEQILTVTRNEILYSLNTPDDFIPGMVEFVVDGGHQVHYLRRSFQREPDFGVTSVNYGFADLLARAEEPS